MSEAAPEFSRMVETDQLGGRTQDLTIEATAEERRRLAARFDLLELRSLRADVSLEEGKAPDTIRVRVYWVADVVQSCVVTLEPVVSHLEQTCDLLYAPPARGGERGMRGEVEIDPEAEDPPEPLIDGRIDVGEALAEQLGLALDPYPRKPDAEVPKEFSSATERENPFQVLRRLKE